MRIFLLQWLLCFSMSSRMESTFEKSGPELSMVASTANASQRRVLHCKLLLPYDVVRDTYATAIAAPARTARRASPQVLEGPCVWELRCRVPGVPFWPFT